MATQYDPHLVTLTVGGHTMVGFHSGTFIKVNRSNPTWKLEKGAQGEGVRTRNRDKSGMVVFTLQSTSPSNSDLRTMGINDEEAIRPEPVPVMLKYGGPADDGAVIWSGKEAWLEKPADSEFADEHTPCEWTLVVDDLRYANNS
jgi:hypothetical protein